MVTLNGKVSLGEVMGEAENTDCVAKCFQANVPKAIRREMPNTSQGSEASLGFNELGQGISLTTCMAAYRNLKGIKVWNGIYYYANFRKSSRFGNRRFTTNQTTCLSA